MRTTAAREPSAAGTSGENGKRSEVLFHAATASSAGLPAKTTEPASNAQRLL